MSDNSDITLTNLTIIMPNKCSVTGCNTNYQDGPKKPVFKFPDDPDLSKEWAEFLNRQDFQITLPSVVCINHFEEIHRSAYQKTLLNYSMSPECRKPPTIRVYQPDEFESFNLKYKIRSLADVIKYIKDSQEYSDLQTVVPENSVTSYRVEIYSGIAALLSI